MLTALIIIAAIAQIIVSLFVFIRGRRNLSYFLFFLIGITSLCWAITNYITVVLLNSNDLLFYVRLILFFVVLQNTCFYLFAKAFPDSSWMHSNKRLILYLGYSSLAALMTISPYVFTSVRVNDGLVATEAGPGILLFIIHAAFSIGAAFKSLYKKLKTATGIYKNQLRILFFASFLIWVVVPITNFVITPLIKTTFFILWSPIYTLLFASIVAYAIVAQRLFDIKAIVARSVAYIFALGLLVAAYTSLANLFVNNLLVEFANPAVNLAVTTILLLSAVLIYPALKSFFDKTTNKFFYHDAYDPQEFLDSLNKVLVGKVDLEPLLKDVASIIQSSLKTEYCAFAIRPTSYFAERIIGTNKRIKFNAEDLAKLHTLTPKVHHRVIIADELGEDEYELKQLMERNDVNVMARLVTTVKYDVEGVGYLLLGAKKSGNVYNSQDENVLRIIANELVIAIENGLRFEEIEKFNATLQKKIEDATKELRMTNEKLKLLDETKDEFISMASHQLRTPLTSVKGYLSMVLEGDAGEVAPMQQKLLDQAFVSSQRMVYLIADLLNVSRLRTGKFIIDPVESNLADVVEGEIGQLKETAAGRGLELKFVKPDNFPKLYLDETKIRQVVMNFTDNAIYYTPRGGHIEVKLEDKGESIELTVNDDGMGVPKTEQPHLFSKFYRAGNAQKARPDGTGLGLFMAKKVVIAQGGNIIFRSEEGKGSTFGFAFPKNKLQPPTTSPDLIQTNQ